MIRFVHTKNSVVFEKNMNFHVLLNKFPLNFIWNIQLEYTKCNVWKEITKFVKKQHVCIDNEDDYITHCILLFYIQTINYYLRWNETLNVDLENSCMFEKKNAFFCEGTFLNPGW